MNSTAYKIKYFLTDTMPLRISLALSILIFLLPLISKAQDKSKISKNVDTHHIKQIRPDKILLNKSLIKLPAATVDSQCGKRSSVFINVMQHKENFIPTQGIPAATVPKVVKIRFMVPVPQSNEKVTFSEDDIKVFDTFTDWFNGVLANLTPPINPARERCGECYISDSRIRFHLEGVTFFPHDSFTRYAEPNDLHTFMVGKDSVLHIFVANFEPYKTPGNYAGITNPKGNGIATFEFNADVNKTFLLLANTYYRYKHDDFWGSMVVMIHELFHEFSLDHLWSTSQCNESKLDYLSDIFGTGEDKDCPQRKILIDSINGIKTYDTMPFSNSVLGIFGYLGASPMELGIIHRESFMGRMHRYMFPVEPPNEHPWIIDSSQVWDFPIRMFQDIIVEQDVIFSVKCKIEMPRNSRIILKPGAKLIVDGGDITSYYDNTYWSGIEIEQPRKRKKRKKESATIAIINNGQVRNNIGIK